MKLLPLGVSGPISMEGTSLFAGSGMGLSAATVELPIASAGGSIPVSGIVTTTLSPGEAIGPVFTPVSPGVPPVLSTDPVFSTSVSPVLEGPKVVYTDVPATAAKPPVSGTGVKTMSAAQTESTVGVVPKWIKPVLICIIIAALAFLGYKYFIKPAKGRR